MNELPNARLLTPLMLSGLLAGATVATFGVLAGQPKSGATIDFATRLLQNPFVLLIFFVGIWAMLYGLLQLWVARSEASPSGLARWLTGFDCSSPKMPVGTDAGLAANLFAERWDQLSGRRMAPLSYAIWVLPLLGFIGTVIGISEAIGDLGTVFGEGDRQAALESVLGALRFAFDTTFAGLVLVIPVMGIATLVGQASERARSEALIERFGGQVES